MMSLKQLQAQPVPEDHGGDKECEGFLPDEFSEGSWETYHSVLDSQGNMVVNSTVENHEAIEAEAEPRRKPSPVAKAPEFESHLSDG